MTIRIAADRTFPETGGAIIATASRRAEGWREGGQWPRFFDRRRAITAWRSPRCWRTGTFTRKVRAHVPL
jgi:hypothetical protein